MKPIGKLLFFILIANFLIQCEKDDPNVVKISDNNFLDALLEQGVDKNGDGIISPEEAEVVTTLDVTNDSITDMTGIEAFVSLDSLLCGFNYLTELDITNNISLKYFGCNHNRLSSLNVTKNTALQKLYCYNNQLTHLDLTNNTELTLLNCSFNLITSLDLSNNTSLVSLYCHFNQLSTLDVSENSSLEGINCDSNLITSINVTNTALRFLYCASNQLDILDISKNLSLEELICGGNLLSSLDISNNTALKILVINEMPSLHEVCVWEMPFPPSGVRLIIKNCPNVFFTDECTDDK